MTRHRDGSICHSGGFDAPVFDDERSCPLCYQEQAALDVENAAMLLHQLHHIAPCQEAAEIAALLKGLHRRIERLTWPKGGAQ